MTDDIKDTLIEDKKEILKEDNNTIITGQVQEEEKDTSKTKKSINKNTELSKKEKIDKVYLGNRVKIREGSKWTSGEYVQEWICQKILYIRSIPKDGKCIVSISQQDLSLGSGEVYLKDLIKI